MFLSKKSAVSAIALSILSLAPIQAARPKTFLGKIGASILQTVNKHPLATSYAAHSIGVATAVLISKDARIAEKLGTCSFFSAFATSFIVETGSKALMRNFEIDPI